MASLLNIHIPDQITDDNGNVQASAKVFIYDATTTDLADTYSDFALTSASSVDGDGAIVADSGGRVPNIYVASGQNYKIVIKTSADVVILTRDNLPPAIVNGSGTLPVSAGGTGASTASGARTALGAAADADLSTLNDTVTAAVTEQADSVWEAGTGTTATTVAPDAIAAAIAALEDQNPGVSSFILEHQETSNTPGGGITTSWTTRTLNTEVYDPGGVVSIASNVFTVTKACEVFVEAIGYSCASFRCRVVDNSDSSVMRTSMTMLSTGAAGNSVVATVRVYLPAGAYRIEHIASSARATDGAGQESNLGTEIYTRVTGRTAHGE